MGKLSSTFVKGAREPGKYGDGDGLYLRVAPSGSKSWIVRVQKDGKRRDIGIGSVSKVPLAEARDRARTTREQVEQGLDPVAERKKTQGIPTFKQAARLVHTEHTGAWKNAKHAKQWLSSLETYAFPYIGDMPVSAVDNAAARDVLISIWLEKPETARRVRQRINSVVDWAVAKGYRDAPLTMSVINKSLPNHKTGPSHFRALPYAEIPAFLNELQDRVSFSRLALEALVLTAARSGEIRGATWDEVDFEQSLWTIPAKRMKAGKEHAIPLSEAAQSAFQRAWALRTPHSNLCFHGQRRGRPMSDMTLTQLLRKMGHAEQATVHGFRSSFRDWVSETTSYNGDIAEAALAHAVKDKTEAAYRRGKLLDKRRTLMEAWGSYCTSGSQSVVRLVQ